MQHGIYWVAVVAGLGGVGRWFPHLGVRRSAALWIAVPGSKRVQSGA